jgi:hypothetical protein
MEPVHVAAWVDDLIFIMSTPEHGECDGFEGGCAVCGDYYGRALKVQEMWQAKASVLNIQLSAKGHAVGQRGAFTGLAIDKHKMTRGGPQPSAYLTVPARPRSESRSGEGSRPSGQRRRHRTRPLSGVRRDDGGGVGEHQCGDLRRSGLQPAGRVPGPLPLRPALVRRIPETASSIVNPINLNFN